MDLPALPEPIQLWSQISSPLRWTDGGADCSASCGRRWPESSRMIGSGLSTEEYRRQILDELHLLAKTSYSRLGVRPRIRRHG